MKELAVSRPRRHRTWGLPTDILTTNSPSLRYPIKILIMTSQHFQNLRSPNRYLDCEISKLDISQSVSWLQGILITKSLNLRYPIRDLDYEVAKLEKSLIAVLTTKPQNLRHPNNDLSGGISNRMLTIKPPKVRYPNRDLDHEATNLKVSHPISWPRSHKTWRIRTEVLTTTPQNLRHPNRDLDQENTKLAKSK